MNQAHQLSPQEVALFLDQSEGQEWARRVPMQCARCKWEGLLAELTERADTAIMERVESCGGWGYCPVCEGDEWIGVTPDGKPEPLPDRLPGE